MKSIGLYCLFLFIILAGFRFMDVAYTHPSGQAGEQLYGSTENPRIGMSTVIADLNVPWDISWGPDNQIWYAEQTGTLSRVNPANGVRTRVLTVPDFYKTNLGLISMILHPEIDQHPFVFLTYPVMRSEKLYLKIVRYNFTPDTLTSPKVLLEIPGDVGHMGSRFAIGRDGKMMIAIGDFKDLQNAQNMQTLNGKILRINIDGSIPADNPVQGNPVWARGFRVPQGLAFNQNGILYSAEHGEANDDEVNLIVKGGNYGYPDVTGRCDSSSEQEYCKMHAIVEPLKAWTPTIAPAGIEYYASNTIPQWNNSLLVTTLKENDLRVLRLNSAGNAVVSETIYLDKRLGRLRDVCVSPAGDVYVSTSNRDWKPGKENVDAHDDKIIKISRLTDPRRQIEIRADTMPSADISGKMGKPAAGQALYTQHCASCHQANGNGFQNLFPALRGAKSVNGNKDSLISIVLNGRARQAKSGQEAQMPAFRFLSDGQIAELLSYVRANFGNDAGKITAAEVSTVRGTR